MKYLTRAEIIGLISALVIIASAGGMLLFKLSFFDTNAFYFALGIAAVIGGLPFLMSLLLESKSERDKDQMFLEFSRDLVEGVRSGTPISKSIINVRNKDYGSLSPNINKLANQISLGVPVKDALEIFSKDVRSPVISRAISLIKEAEKSGGKIESILESVSFSISQIEKLKKERKAAVYNLAVQGYIIFIIFIAIMLVMQFKILTILPDLGNIDSSAIGGGLDSFGGLGGGSSTRLAAGDLDKPFLFLLIAQGFFSGLVIGKIAEGRVKYGFKHSFIMVALAWLISTGAKLVLS